jgi:hypothetical protein
VTPSPEGGDLPGLGEIAAEIQALRKNRAFSGDVSEKMGPVLLELAGGDARQANDKLGRALRSLAGRLSEEMQTAILAALALHPDTREMTTYSQRRRWLADTKLDRGERTAERRIDEAQRLLAQEIAVELQRRRGQSDDGWYIDHFSAVFMLDGDAPEAIERRRIVSTRHALTEITIVLDTPRESGQRRLGVKADVTHGGTLVRTEELSRNRTQYTIGLPRPLRPDETHEYEMRLRVEPDEPMRAYYVFRPERRCDGFDLRVRFDRRNPPAWVRRVADEDVHVYYPYEGVPAPAERVPVDATGEARSSFTRLRQHLGYGLQWSAALPRQYREPSSTGSPALPGSRALPGAGHDRAEFADALGGGEAEHPDRRVVAARTVLQGAQKAPVGVGQPGGARAAERDHHAAVRVGLLQRLGSDVADVADQAGRGPFRYVVDGDDEVGLDPLLADEEQPEGPVPPGHRPDEGGDAVDHVLVGDEGGGHQVGRLLAGGASRGWASRGGTGGGGPSGEGIHVASLTRRVTV